MRADRANTFSGLVMNYTEAHWFLTQMRDKLKDDPFDTPWQIGCEPYRETRSLQQNRRYWGVVMKAIADQMPAHMDGVHHMPELWHHYCKRRFLGFEVIEIHGEAQEVPRSTRTLTVSQFGEYMTEVEAWAVSEGVVFE